MSKSISIKELRENLAGIADRVAEGESFEVIRRSKPAFKIVPSGTETDEKWETVIDFTEGGKKKGMPAKDFIRVLKEVNAEDGQN